MKNNGQKKKMNMGLKAVLISFSIIAGLLVLIVIVSPIAETYTYLHPQKNNKLTTWPDDKALGLYYDTYRITISDGQFVGAWLIPAQKSDNGADYNFDFIESDKLVIFSHNYQSNRCGEDVSAMWVAAALSHSGYNVLTFDYSGSGMSNSDSYMLGVREKDELNDVISFAHNTLGYDDIALIGWGYGAASSLMAGAANEHVSAIVSDTCYADLKSYLSEYGNRWSSMPSWTNKLFTDLCRMMSGEMDLFGQSPISAVSAAKDKHFFFIHGAEDDLMPESGSEEIASAVDSSCTADVWIVDGANHLEAYSSHPENYVARVIAFLNGVYDTETYD